LRLRDIATPKRPKPKRAVVAGSGMGAALMALMALRSRPLLLNLNQRPKLT